MDQSNKPEEDGCAHHLTDVKTPREAGSRFVSGEAGVGLLSTCCVPASVRLLGMRRAHSSKAPSWSSHSTDRGHGKQTIVGKIVKSAKEKGNKKCVCVWWGGVQGEANVWF